MYRKGIFTVRKAITGSEQMITKKSILLKPVDFFVINLLSDSF